MKKTFWQIVGIVNIYLILNEAPDRLRRTGSDVKSLDKTGPFDYEERHLFSSENLYCIYISICYKFFIELLVFLDKANWTIRLHTHP